MTNEMGRGLGGRPRSPIVVISILLHRETLGLVQNLRMERELLLQVPLLSFSRLCRFVIEKSIK